MDDGFVRYQKTAFLQETQSTESRRVPRWPTTVNLA